MSRFKKAGAETDSSIQRIAENYIPNYLEEAVFGKQETIAEDPYAALREQQGQRRAATARDQIGQRASQTAAEPHEWERMEKQAEYRQPRFAPSQSEVNYNDYFAQDVSGRSVNRISDGESSDRGLRDTSWAKEGLAMVTTADAMALMLRGASIWHPNQEDAADIMQESMDIFDSQKNAKNRRDQQANRHADWQSRQMNAINRHPLTARAHSVVRTHTEEVAAGKAGLRCNSEAGMLDKSWLDNSEADRMEMIANKRAQSQGIKRTAANRGQRHNEWEENAKGGLTRAVQDRDSDDWASSLLRSASKFGTDN